MIDFREKNYSIAVLLLGPIFAVILIVGGQQSAFEPSHADSIIILHFEEDVLRFLLPRSIFEIGFIEHHLGFIKALQAATMEFVSSSCGLFFIGFALIKVVTSHKTIKRLSIKQVVVATLISVAAIIFRPASDSTQSLVKNSIEPFAFYLIRESIWISIGYYYLCCLLVNLTAGYAFACNSLKSEGGST